MCIRDRDSARILRPVGTHNRKTNPPKAVELVKEGKQYPIEVLKGKLERYIKENNVKPAPVNNRKAIANPFAAALGDYPTADAEVIAEHCFAIREFRDKQGDIPEPHWHRAIGVVKHCDNGEQIIHDWSKGYKGYNKGETQAKIDEWAVGPTSCVEMDSILGCMKDCPVSSKCKYPIQLGHKEEVESVQEETQPEEVVPQSTVPVIEGQTIPYWPSSGYRWNGKSLSRSITVSYTHLTLPTKA